MPDQTYIAWHKSVEPAMLAAEAAYNAVLASLKESGIPDDIAQDVACKSREATLFASYALTTLVAPLPRE